jgi:urease accessory protein
MTRLQIYRRIVLPQTAPMFLSGGLLHGSAYAESIIGSDATSLNGYLLGFALVQSVLAVSVAWGAYAIWCGDRLYHNARLAGGITLGIGLGTLWQSSLMV